MNLGMVIRRNPLLLALAAAAAAVMLFISEGSYFRSVSTLNALGAMATARSSLQGLERSFLDAETGQRGYLLTERNGVPAALRQCVATDRRRLPLPAAVLRRRTRTAGLADAASQGVRHPTVRAGIDHRVAPAGPRQRHARSRAHRHRQGADGSASARSAQNCWRERRCASSKAARTSTAP